MRIEPRRNTPCDGDVAGQVALKHPSRVCCVDDVTHMTWGEHIVLRNRMVNMMREKGIEETDSIACYGRNCNEWILVRTSCNAVGAVFVPLNCDLSTAEVEYQISNSNVTILFAEKKFEGVVLQLDRSKTPNLRKVIYFEDLYRLLNHYSDSYPEVNSYQLNKKLMYTGGTSGVPKGVLRSARPPPASAEERQTRQELIEGKYGERTGLNIVGDHIVHLVAAPLYHPAAGFFETFTYNNGGTVVLLKDFDVEELLSSIDLYAVKTIFLPPILLKRIVCEDSFNLDKYSLKSLQSVCMAGGPCPMAVKEAALRRGLPIYEFYGSSEAGMTTILQPQDMLSKPNSCGRVAMGTKIKIISPTTNEEVPANEAGVVYIQSAESMSLTYFGGEEEAAQVQLSADPSYVTVGDIGHLDNEGFLFIHDRLVDMIITGGVNVYPAEVESALHAHEAVADCAVFGIPDPAYGEQVYAVIQPKVGMFLTSGDIQRHLDQIKIDKFKRPKIITFTDSLPRTPSGKLLKRTLRQPFWAEVKPKL